MKTDDLPVPGESESIRILRDLAVDADMDEEILREILWLTTAHPNLLAFATAAERLQQILMAIPETWKDAVDGAGIGAWQPIIDWLCQEKPTLIAAIGEHFGRRVNTTKSNPLRGSHSTEFPFYATLCEPLPPGHNGDLFILLSAQLLIAHVIAMRDNSALSEYEIHGKALQWKFLPNAVDSAARAIRRLAEAKYQPALPALPVDRPPEMFAELLETLPLPTESDLARDRPCLLRFLQKALGLLDWREKNGGGGGGGKGGHRWVGGRLVGPNLTVERDRSGADDDPAGGLGVIDLVRFHRLSSRKRNARLRSDLPPDEDTDDEEVLLSDFECEITRQDPGSLARAARAKARHVAKNNQMLSWAYDTLADPEIGALLQHLRHSSDQLLTMTDWADEQRLEAAAVFMLLAMTLTGSSRERVLNVRIYGDKSMGKETDLCLVSPQARPVAHIHWRMRPLSPDYKTDLENPEDTDLRPQAGEIDLPDHFGLAQLVERLLVPGNKAPHGEAIFGWRSDDYMGTARHWLNRRFSGGRITLNKIEGILWSRVYRRTGDAALASCVCGVNHPLARVSLFYTSPWESDLRRLYEEALKPYLPSTHCPAPEQSTGVATPLTLRAAGARLCPTVAAVQSMFTRLLDDIKQAEAYLDRSGFVRYHNLLTLYSVQFFAYSTTCRAIVTPYLPLTAVDAERFLASLSDKDDATKHKTRLVWIPPMLYRQMASYEKHLTALKDQLFDLPKSCADEPCLFLDADFRPMLVRPKTIEPLLNGYLNVRANTHRRFLRTELLERGAPPEMIDALMGHWQNGQEPFGVFSSFSFKDYVHYLREYLVPLLEEIGLTQACRGSLAW